MASREELLHNNQRKGSRPKYFNKDTDTSRPDRTKSTIDRHQTKINSVRFEDPNNQINTMDNTNDGTQIIYAHE